MKDGYVYETNYTTGLRILKIGNLESTNPQDWLQEVAYYDTYAATTRDVQRRVEQLPVLPQR